MGGRTGNEPEIIGHGGAGGHAPGNSRAALEAGLRLGVHRVECDLRLTADGDLALVHDAAVSGVDGSVPVRASTSAGLRQRLPGLLVIGEAVELVAGRVPFMLDLKEADAAPALITAIRRHGLAEASSVSCRSWPALRRLRAGLPGMRLGLSVGDLAAATPTRPARAIARQGFRRTLPLWLPGALRSLDATEVMLSRRMLTPGLVRAVHRVGKRVNVWTLDDPDDLRRAIAAGVDGVITNYPDRAQTG